MDEALVEVAPLFVFAELVNRGRRNAESTASMNIGAVSKATLVPATIQALSELLLNNTLQNAVLAKTGLEISFNADGPPQISPFELTTTTTSTTAAATTTTAAATTKPTAATTTTSASTTAEPTPPLPSDALAELNEDYDITFGIESGVRFETAFDEQFQLAPPTNASRCLAVCRSSAECEGVFFYYLSDVWLCVPLSDTGSDTGVASQFPSYSYTRPPRLSASGSTASLTEGQVALVVVMSLIVLVVVAVVFVRRYNLSGGGSGFGLLRRPAAVFEVVVERKQPFRDNVPDHPWTGRGSDQGFSLRQTGKRQSEFTPGQTLHLVRGKTYHFKMCNVPKDYPFYISFSDVGGGNGLQEYLRGVQNSPVAGTDTLIFRPPPDSPSLLYYQCTRHKCMGYRIHLSDPHDADSATKESIVTITDTAGVFAPNEDDGEEAEFDDALAADEMHTSRVSFARGMDNVLYDTATLFDHTDLQLHDDDAEDASGYAAAGGQRRRHQGKFGQVHYDQASSAHGDSADEAGSARFREHSYDRADDEDDALADELRNAALPPASLYKPPPKYASALKAAVQASESRETPQYVPPPQYELAKRYQGSRVREESMDAVYRPPPPYLCAADIERQGGRHESSTAVALEAEGTRLFDPKSPQQAHGGRQGEHVVRIGGGGQLATGNGHQGDDDGDANETDDADSFSMISAIRMAKDGRMPEFVEDDGSAL